jgi:outer membrane lipoprotein SlyB
MKVLVGCAAIILTLATVTSVNAKGCLKGAVVGGVGGHYAAHHGILGAAAGCVIGRHEANKRDRIKQNQDDQANHELRNNNGQQRF